MDAHKNFAYSTVATAPSPATSGTTLVVASGDGAKFPAVPFNATIWPASAAPTTANAEIVRVTNISSDTLTITRTQESTSARTVIVGDQIADTITIKTLTDIETNVWSTALGGTGQTTAKAARGFNGLNIEDITSMVDANKIMAATDRNVYTTVSFTATRTVTLPAANAVNPGAIVVISDAFGAINGTRWLVVTSAGADTVDGAVPSIVMITARQYVVLQSDGFSNWVQIVPLVIGLNQGGTGQPGKGAGFAALSPQTTRGDIIVENSTPTPARLAVGAANTVLRSNGTDPAWAASYRESQVFVPTGAIAQSLPRIDAGSNIAALTSGQLTCVAIWLPSDTLISSITFVSATTAMGATGANQWFTIADSSRVRKGITSDDTSTAWPANTAKTLSLAVAYTTTYEGLYYLGVMVKTSGAVPTLAGKAAQALTKDIAPILGGQSTASLTNPASCPSTLGAISGQSALVYAYVS